MRKYMKWLVGKYRLFWNRCPACNCDAPATDKCNICDNYRHSGEVYPPSKIIKELWWLHYWIGNDEYIKRCEGFLKDVFSDH